MIDRRAAPLGFVALLSGCLAGLGGSSSKLVERQALSPAVDSGVALRSYNCTRIHLWDTAGKEVDKKGRYPIAMSRDLGQHGTMKRIRRLAAKPYGNLWSVGVITLPPGEYKIHQVDGFYSGGQAGQAGTGAPTFRFTKEHGGALDGMQKVDDSKAPGFTVRPHQVTVLGEMHCNTNAGIHKFSMSETAEAKQEVLNMLKWELERGDNSKEDMAMFQSWLKPVEAGVSGAAAGGR